MSFSSFRTIEQSTPSRMLYSPQSSSSCGACSRLTGSRDRTSNSVPQSGQSTISPVSTSAFRLMSASQSRHLGMKSPTTAKKTRRQVTGVGGFFKAARNGSLARRPAWPADVRTLPPSRVLMSVGVYFVKVLHNVRPRRSISPSNLVGQAEVRRPKAAIASSITKTAEMTITASRTSSRYWADWKKAQS